MKLFIIIEQRRKGREKNVRYKQKKEDYNRQPFILFKQIYWDKLKKYKTMDDGGRINIVDKLFLGYTWYTFHNKTQQK